MFEGLWYESRMQTIELLQLWSLLLRLTLFLFLSPIKLKKEKLH